MIQPKKPVQNEVTPLGCIVGNFVNAKLFISNNLEIIDQVMKDNPETLAGNEVKACRNITENFLFDLENIIRAISSALGG